MSNIKIFTDSTNDLTPEIIRDNDISVIPLYVNFDNESYQDGVDITPEEIYKKVEVSGKLPKTAAASPIDFYRAFKPYIDEGRDILYIGLSSSLSSTLQNAKIAAEEFPAGRIEIVDSMNLSSAIGLLVMKAVDYSKQGLGITEVAERVRKRVPRVRTAFAIDGLDYLYKGGRCSALQSFVGSVLRIRPIIKVVEGKMVLGQKTRGKRSQAINTMLSSVLSDKENMELDRIIVTHALSPEDAEYLKKELENKVTAKEVLITNAGCVISSHCGPNTVGIRYIAKEVC
jgi:DegV family protein with EDD domain